MKKAFIYSVICFLLFSCGSQKVTQSYWHDEQYTKSIAGKLKFDSQSGLMYSLSNDEKNLYVDLRISDRTIQQKIFSMGLTVWIDTIGKKQETLGITFPMGIRAAMAGRMPQKGQQPANPEQGQQMQRRPENRNMMAATTQTIKLTGFEGLDELKNTNEAIPGVISGKIERDAMNILQYTLVIPFEKIPQIENKAFSVGIKTGSINMADMAAMRERMMAQGGMRPQGGGNFTPGGGQRPGGGFSPGNMEAMSNPTELWVKNIQISKKNN